MKRILVQRGFTFAKDRYSENRLDKDGDHSSSTHILKATMNGTLPVAIKLFLTKNPNYAGTPKKWLDVLHQTNQTLLYEAKIYARVTKIPELRDNIIKFVAFEEQNLNDLHLNSLEEAEMFDDIKSILPSRFFHDATADMLTLNMLVTEFTAGKPLLDVFWEQESIYQKPFDFDTIVPIFFQIIWGIQTLQRYGIQHNDMHQGNVFIVQNKGPKSIKSPKAQSSPYSQTHPKRQYTSSNGDIFVMPDTAPTVLLFDWDWANTPEEGNPIFAGAGGDHYCKEYGYCDILNERRDIFRAIFQFFNETKIMPPQAVDFVYYFLSGPKGTALFDLKGSNPPDNGMLCNLSYDGFCHPYPANEPSEIRSCAELLAHPIFEKYKLQPMHKDNRTVADFLNPVSNATDATNAMKPTNAMRPTQPRYQFPLSSPRRSKRLKTVSTI
jgi:serine/threonine protein kinase